MKIKINEEVVYELDSLKKKIICNDIMEDIFDEDMKRRVRWVIEQKVEGCMRRLKEEWMPKLQKRMDLIPSKDEKIAQLIFSQPDYKCRKTRELEEKA